MVSFANCKINLGLQVLRKRPDGYHDVSTVMIPVPWCDVVEAVAAENPQGEDTLTVTGNRVDCPVEKNLAMKALRAMRADENVPEFPAVSLHLHKVVPDGAGLGGGSSDAAHVIRAVNAQFGLGLEAGDVARLAACVGSDCPFFAYDRPMWCTGTGTEMTPVDIPQLSSMHLVVAKPRGVAVSTGSAYSMVTPDDNVTPLDEILALPVSDWQGVLVNDFEAPIVKLAPAIGHVRDAMLQLGACYAAMTGSGAAVFGLFDRPVSEASLKDALHSCDSFSCTLH